MHDILCRKQVTFDIDTKIANKIFGAGYRSIYLDIEEAFEASGFIHQQGSVYQSVNKVSSTFVSFLLSEIIGSRPGIEKCIRDIRLTDVTNENDLNHLCSYDGTLGKYPDKTRNRQREERER